MVFFGDGATSEGDFHEGLNFAGVFQTPVVFVCQNNQWAISIPRSKQTRSETLAQKALAYGIPGIQVDGNDVLAVYSAAAEAVERARGGEGPTLIECLTYRMSVHTTADDPKRYRKDEEVHKWEKRDPIVRFQKYLTDKDILSKQKMDDIKDPLNMFDYILAELPTYTREQKEELRQELQDNHREDSSKETEENGQDDNGSSA